MLVLEHTLAIAVLKKLEQATIPWLLPDTEFQTLRPLSELGL